jgi:DNA topoisomerase-1
VCASGESGFWCFCHSEFKGSAAWARRKVEVPDVTAKDFRTWGATVFAAASLAHGGDPTSAKDAKQRVVAAVKETAAALGHCPATCRSFYIHPWVIGKFEAGEMSAAMIKRPQPGRAGGRTSLNIEERCVLKMLKTSESP